MVPEKLSRDVLKPFSPKAQLINSPKTNLTSQKNLKIIEKYKIKSPHLLFWLQYTFLDKIKVQIILIKPAHQMNYVDTKIK